MIGENNTKFWKKSKKISQHSLDFTILYIYNEFMIQYNLDLLRNLFNDFNYLINAPISFYDDNFNATSVHSQWTANHLCEIIKDEWKMRHRCSVSDEKVFQRFRNGENAFFYSCHFGLIEIAFRFTANKETYGYVIIGPFKDPKKTKENIELIKRLMERQPTEKIKRALHFYHKIPHFSLEKYHAIRNLCSTIFEYARNHNIISQKSNLFSEEIATYILENLDQPLSIEFLCKKFFLSQKQLYRIFEINAKKTPKRYINEQRINKARHMIISGNQPLPEIAAAVGVSDYNYFIKMFKAYDGHTPMYYRKH